MNYNVSGTYLPQQNGSVEFPNINSNKCEKKKSHKNVKPICVNLADTHYDVIQRICDQMSWKLQYNESKNWDLKWNDNAINGQYLSKLLNHQKINHFPGMNTLHRKNNLAKNLYRMQDQYPDQYHFFPRTFLLPYDFNRLKSYYQQTRKQGILKTFIVKPQANCQGRGIFLTQDIQQIIEYEHCIVQKYVSNPLLYKGLKFDLRIYALVAGCDPLRIYIYNQGLVRFSTEKYEFPSEQNMDDLYMHLTNYAINKDNPKYVFNDSLQNLSYGHKKSLAQFFQTLKTMGYKAHQYWSDIKDIIVKTLISGQPHLQHEYRMAQPHNLQNNMCFEVLGFDFMIDANDKCYLLEINHTPSFSTDTPLDELIKSNLIRDTISLMNITPKARNEAIFNAKQAQKKRVFTGKTAKLTSEQRALKVNELQKQRDQYEKHHLGSYECIFPSKIKKKQQKYLALLEISQDTYKQMTNGNRNNRKTPAKFRIKRLITNQSRPEGSESTELFEKEKSIKKSQNTQNTTNASSNIKQTMVVKVNNQPDNPLMHLMSKRTGLKTSSEQMTMFSRKLEGSRNKEMKIPVDIHI